MQSLPLPHSSFLPPQHSLQAVNFITFNKKSLTPGSTMSDLEKTPLLNQSHSKSTSPHSGHPTRAQLYTGSSAAPLLSSGAQTDPTSEGSEQHIHHHHHYHYHWHPEFSSFEWVQNVRWPDSDSIANVFLTIIFFFLLYRFPELYELYLKNKKTC
ncbi:hypothetical protein BJ165DRAFT_130040 [Panaeolus papilionaceus]|nr:hypothetical protein BJ165DRAFT_130040 [Panaeolus papilionaceus]